MERNTLRLGVACLVALTTTSPGLAAVDDTVADIREDCRPARYCDALIEFLIGTGGEVTVDTLGAGLIAAFESMTARNLRDVPRLMRDLVDLGIDPEVRDVVECELVDMVCSSSSLSYSGKANLLRSLANVPGGVACYGLARPGEGVRLQGLSQAGAVEGDKAAACVSVHGAYQT